jgi:ubiquinone/menaquinone biosynthesis C-methylase UbiE
VFYGIKEKILDERFYAKKKSVEGDENVLDIGAGTGLLMNGVAKFLTTGKSIRIDIWRPDLSDNTIENALRNRIRKCKDKIEILTQDARSLSFADNTFDVIVSMFCIHNIDDKKSRKKLVSKLHEY